MGYSRSLLKKAYKRALFLQRSKLLFSRTKKQDDTNVRFVTTFNGQHKDLKNILSKYWFLLTLDSMGRNFVPCNPSITFRKSRKSRLFRDSLTTSHLDLHDQPKPANGTFPCGACAYCANLDTRSPVSLPDNTTWTSWHFVDCTSRGIVYLLSCPCGAFYVGITRREFHKRIYDHVYAAAIGYYKSPIGKPTG